MFLRDGRCLRSGEGSYDELLTCGDAVPDCDAPVAVRDVLGIVVG